MTHPTSIYQGKSLNNAKAEIRLLKIELDNQIWAARYSLEVHPSATAPAYYALSYEWGRPCTEQQSHSFCIVVDDITVKLQPNLFAFFRQLPQLVFASNGYLVDPTFYLWIDFLCINQADVEEKNSQVSIMNEIYANSTMILAWLGPEADNSSQAIALINRLNMHRWGNSRRDGTAVSRGLSSMFTKNDPQVIDALVKLLSREYWQRGWIIQELAAENHVLRELFGSRSIARFYETKYESWRNRRRMFKWKKIGGNLLHKRSCLERTSVFDSPIICGNDFFEFGELYGLLTQVNLVFSTARLNAVARPTFSNTLIGMNNAELLNQAERIFRAGRYAGNLLSVKFLTKQYTLLQLLIKFRGSLTGRQVDRIYCLIGLARSYDGQPEVDYRRDWRQTYKVFAMHMIRNAQSLDLLACAGVNAEGLPSWVPHRRGPIKNHVLSEQQPVGLAHSGDGEIVVGSMTWSAGGNKAELGMCEVNGDILTIAAKRAGRITAVYQNVDNHDDTQEHEACEPNARKVAEQLSHIVRFSLSQYTRALWRRQADRIFRLMVYTMYGHAIGASLRRSGIRRWTRQCWQCFKAMAQLRLCRHLILKTMAKHSCRHDSSSGSICTKDYYRARVWKYLTWVCAT